MDTDTLFKVRTLETRVGTATEPIQITNIQIEVKRMLSVDQFILGFPRITGGCFH